MGSVPNRHFRQGAGVPGMRSALRRGHLVIDVHATVDGRKVATSYLLDTAGPLSAARRAVQFREKHTGQPYPFTPRQAWMRLRDHRSKR